MTKMGQYEVLTFLKQQRDKGNDQYFSIGQVREAMKSLGVNDDTVGGILLSCERYNLVEAKYSMNVYAWHRMFRMTEATWKRFKKMEQVDGKLQQ